MTKITDLNKAALIALRPQIDAALAELGATLGLSIHAASGSYAGANAKFTLEIKVDDPAVQEAKERATFDANCSLFGLAPSDFGLEFTASRKRFKLVGLALSRSKYPLKVLALDDGNKAMLLSEMAVPAIVAARPAKAA